MAADLRGPCHTRTLDVIWVRGQAEWSNAGQLLPLHADAEQGHLRIYALDHHLVHIMVRQWKLDPSNSPNTRRIGANRDAPPGIGATTCRTVGNDRLHAVSSRSRLLDTALCPFKVYPAPGPCARAGTISAYGRLALDLKRGEKRFGATVEERRDPVARRAPEDHRRLRLAAGPQHPHAQPQGARAGGGEEDRPRAYHHHRPWLPGAHRQPLRRREVVGGMRRAIRRGQHERWRGGWRQPRAETPNGRPG